MSIISKPKDSLNPDIWDKNMFLRDDVKDFIMRNLYQALKTDFKDMQLWIDQINIIGSNTSNQYSEHSDLDIDVQIDEEKFKKSNPQYENVSIADIKKMFNEMFSLHCEDLFIPETKIPVHYHVSSTNNDTVSEGIYDITRDMWSKEPVILPINFDPYKAFMKEHEFAQKMAPHIKRVLAKIYQELKNDKTFEQGIQKAKRLHKILKTLRVMRLLDTPMYSSFDYSLNWDYRNVIYKFLDALNLTEIRSLLIKMLPDKKDKILESWKKYVLKLSDVKDAVETIESAYWKRIA